MRDRLSPPIGAGMPCGPRVVREHVTPVDHRGVEDHVGDVVGQPRAAQRLQHDGPTHRPAHEEQLARAALHGVQAGVLDVPPLREAEVVAAVRPAAAPTSLR